MDLLFAALQLALYGMGSVFIFLTLLVGCTMLMSYWVGDAVSRENSAQPSVDSRVLAAIAVAVKYYRDRHILK